MEENEITKIQDSIIQERKPAKIKRFYKQAKVKGRKAPFGVWLDKRVLKTPNKLELEMPTRSLAKAIVDEWNGQDDFIDVHAMHLTKYANLAAEQVAGMTKEPMIDEIVAYASSDLVCYRADTPQGLVERQEKAWDPVLQWAQKRHKLSFICVAGVVYASQPDATLISAHKLLTKKDYYSLTAIQQLTILLGSALLALAVVETKLSGDQCWDAAHLDEDWNIELWGSDDDAIKRRKMRRNEYDSILKFAELI